MLGAPDQLLRNATNVMHANAAARHHRPRRPALWTRARADSFPAGELVFCVVVVLEWHADGTGGKERFTRTLPKEKKKSGAIYGGCQIEGAGKKEEGEERKAEMTQEKRR